MRKQKMHWLYLEDMLIAGEKMKHAKILAILAVFALVASIVSAGTVGDAVITLPKAATTTTEKTTSPSSQQIVAPSAQKGLALPPQKSADTPSLQATDSASLKSAKGAACKAAGECLSGFCKCVCKKTTTAPSVNDVTNTAKASTVSTKPAMQTAGTATKTATTATVAAKTGLSQIAITGNALVLNLPTKSVGEACTVNSNCKSNLCTSGKCACKLDSNCPQGETCKIATGLCSKPATTAPIAATTSPVATASVKPAAAIADAKSLGTVADSTKDPKTEGTAPLTPKKEGEVCAANGDCEMNSCLCSCEDCTGDKDCSPGNKCLNSVCTPALEVAKLKSLNAECNSNEECESSLCKFRKVGGFLGLGGKMLGKCACSKEGDCKEGETCDKDNACVMKIAEEVTVQTALSSSVSRKLIKQANPLETVLNDLENKAIDDGVITWAELQQRCPACFISIQGDSQAAFDKKMENIKKRAVLLSDVLAEKKIINDAEAQQITSMFNAGNEKKAAKTPATRLGIFGFFTKQVTGRVMDDPLKVENPSDSEKRSVNSPDATDIPTNEESDEQQKRSMPSAVCNNGICESDERECHPICTLDCPQDVTDACLDQTVSIKGKEVKVRDIAGVEAKDVASWEVNKGVGVGQTPQEPVAGDSLEPSCGDGTCDENENPESCMDCRDAPYYALFLPMIDATLNGIETRICAKLDESQKKGTCVGPAISKPTDIPSGLANPTDELDMLPIDDCLGKCSEGEICKEGVCLKVISSCKTGFFNFLGTPCPSGFDCINNICVAQSCEKTGCPVGQECIKGVCVSSSSTSDNGKCDAKTPCTDKAMKCIDNTCIKATKLCDTACKLLGRACAKDIEGKAWCMDSSTTAKQGVNNAKITNPLGGILS